MLFTTSYLVLALAATSFASSLKSPPLNLKARLEDHSWNLGHSSLVAVAANSSCTAVFSCADCSTAQICRPTGRNTFSLLQKTPCPAERPYCNYGTGSCSTKPDEACGQNDDFICLKENGHFPDKNCSHYHVCEGFVSHKFECKIPGQNYNADTKKCDSNHCATFTCDGPGLKTANNLYPSFYSYCEIGNPAQPGVIDRCDGINQLNATSQLCEPICSKEGVLEDVEDCTKYYKCSYLWINATTNFLIRERSACPENTGFDPRSFICVSLSDYPTCKAPTSPPPTTAGTTQSTTATQTNTTINSTTTKPTTAKP